MSGMYDDIIDLPHHVSLSRPKMSRRDRAAQFAPFSALTGYGAIVSEEARLTSSKIELDEYEKELINNVILEVIDRIEEMPRIKVTYFEPDARKSGGQYVLYEGQVVEVDEFDKKILFDDGKGIFVEDIISIAFVEGSKNEQI